MKNLVDNVMKLQFDQLKMLMFRYFEIQRLILQVDQLGTLIVINFILLLK